MQVSEIAATLRACGRTQAELAKHLGLSRVHVSQMLSGKRRMNVDTFRQIEAFLADAERKAAPSGVAETAAPFAHRPPIRCITLQEARALRDQPRQPLAAEDRARLLKEIEEIGTAGRTLPRITNMTDDEILGYDDVA